ncbi:MAG: hypothetical protein QXG12_04315, partial [Thermoproteota archaeon]
MTKPGYTHIIVPKTLHQKLKREAERRGLSISKLIEQLVDEYGINTGINTDRGKNRTKTAPDAEGVMSPYISSKQEASSNHDSRWG